MLEILRIPGPAADFGRQIMQQLSNGGGCFLLRILISAATPSDDDA
jgi:hypothetical protein